MSDKIIKFPINSRQWVNNHHGKNTIDCYLSGRYLRFHHLSDTKIDGLAVFIDVMTDNYGQKPDRKLCELILVVDELKALVARLEDLQP